ncbi:hypothetical protein FRC04_003448 [Tulasnella sp. 424]|nr:hypothetical protein FRC04_003448 [Tulasnella sp. 424]KAG8965767.1 hypothetical protein FRC05_003026 [Tulasnella sp. 425]
MHGPYPSVEQCAASFDATFQGLQDQVSDTSPETPLEIMNLRLQSRVNFKTFFDNSVRDRTVKLIRERNTLIPIGKLPAELLGLIFYLVLFTPSGRRWSRFVPRITTLGAVCRWWRDIVQQTPSFWAQISSTDHADFVSEALERSHQVPLHLTYIGRYADGPKSPFLDKALPHLHRWESVAIHQPNVIAVATYFSLPAPALKALRLSTRSEQATQPVVFGNLFGGVLENLEEFRVASWKEIDWRVVSCRRLRVLDIERENFLDMGVIFNILSANPSLEVLRLHTLHFNPYTTPNPLQASIYLDHLKELTLTDLMETPEYRISGNGALITHILQRVRFRTGIPFIMGLGLETGPPSTPEAFMSLIPNPVETLASLSRKDNGLQRVDVNVWFGERFLFEIREDPHSKPIFSISIQSNDLPRRLAKDWTTEALRGGAGTPMGLRLHVRNRGSEFPLDEIFEFRSWESVANLSLDGGFQTPSSIGPDLLRLLATPCMSEEGRMVMPFPRLRSLRISGLSGIKGKDMLAFVQARFAEPASTEAAIHDSIPASLTIHCGNGVGGWRSKYMDRILEVPGVEGLNGDTNDGGSRFYPRPASPTLSGSHWPPPYDYGPSRGRVRRGSVITTSELSEW